MNTPKVSSNPTSTVSTVIAEVASMKHDMISILRSPEWPSAASNHIDAFIHRLGVGPIHDTVREDEIILSKAIKDSVEALRSEHTNLEAKLKAYDKSKKRNYIKRVGAGLSSSSLNAFLDRCRTNIETNLAVLDQQLHEANKAKVTIMPSNETTPAPVSSTSTSTPAPEADPPVAGTTSDDQSRRSWQWLDAVKVAFKTSDAVSVIPLVGSYLGAALKAGSTVIEMVETMTGNDEVAKRMEHRFRRLSEMLDRVKHESEEPKAVEAIKVLQTELDGVAAEAQTLQPRGGAAKFISGQRVAADFKDLKERVQNALEDAQAEATLTSGRILKEMYNDSLMNLLGDGTRGARADLGESARCLPGTRVALLTWIDAWIEDENTAEQVLWITGSAGRGKSTVASTVAKKWKEHGPCALFHFRRGQNALDTKLICSLAKQLATSGDMQLLDAIRNNVRNNKDIAQQPLDEQFTTLLVSPLENYERKRVLIVVDALDECATPSYASGFVKLVKHKPSSFPPNVKFLLTTRPEYPLLPNLQNPNNLVRNLDLEPDEDVCRDIQQYLRDGFSKIAAERHNIPVSWPSDTTILQLAGMSEGLFQWAQTVLVFVDSRDPTTQLERILASPGRSVGLDKLYGQILVKAVAQAEETGLSKDLLFDILGTIVAAATPVSLDVIAFLHDGATALRGKDLTTVTSRLRNDVLADVNSLLLIPSTTSDPVLLAHTSIRDFLLDKERCVKQSLTSGVDIRSNHRQLATSCLERMNRTLKQNICGLSDASEPFSEVKDTALSRIPTGLQYCCRAWSFHLIGSGQQLASDVQMSSELVVYSTTKSLFWLEVMAALGCLSQAIEMARDTSHWLSTIDFVSDSESLPMLWNDVQRFASAFAEPMSFNPLEIYRSALATCPTDTELWRRFQSLAQIRALRGLHGSRWSADVWTKAVGSAVATVAISPDGKLLASGSLDETIRLWDVHTGSRVGEPLRGHTDCVMSVCFSPDGNLLPAWSPDKTIRLWDAHTRSQGSKPPKRQTDHVWSVCFSPDGNLLASASDDGTIRLWDAHIGSQVGEPFQGHTGPVWSICFSPDGNLLASGSSDMTIRLWDAHTGSQLDEPLEGHTDHLTSVCFSPDGSLLASASSDETIRLWDAHTWSQVGEPLKGHMGSVSSVCFSPDGNLLASASDDGTIRLWDAHTGSQVGEPLKGGRGSITSVCFSPDGKLLASGFGDWTICLWDAHSRSQVGESLKGHTYSITSVCFLPDGKFLASASDDGTIRLWDAHNGSQVGEPLQGHTASIISVCFSPDGNLLASASNDGTIRLWDARTGSQVGEPLKGHTGGSITSVRFSKDGKLMASESRNGMTREWDVHTGIQDGELHRGRTNTVLSSFLSSNDVSSSNPWISVRYHRPPYRHLLWLPRVYWRKPPDHFLLSHGTLVLVYDKDICIFDVTRVLDPVVARRRRRVSFDS